MDLLHKLEEIKGMIATFNSSYLPKIERYLEALSKAMNEGTIPPEEHTVLYDNICRIIDCAEAMLVKAGHPHLAAALEMIKKLERAREILNKSENDIS